MYAEFRSNVKQGGSVSSALPKLPFRELVGFHRELSPPPEAANSQEVPEDAAAADKSAAPPSAKKARKEKNVAMLSCYMDRLAKHRKRVNMYVRCFFSKVRGLDLGPRWSSDLSTIEARFRLNSVSMETIKTWHCVSMLCQVRLICDQVADIIL